MKRKTQRGWFLSLWGAIVLASGAVLGNETDLRKSLCAIPTLLTGLYIMAEGRDRILGEDR